MKKKYALGVTIAAAGIMALAACGGYGGGGYGGGGGGGGGYSSSMSSTSFLATDVVRDTATAGVAHTDTHLVNGWGVAFNPNGYVWVANNGTNTSTLYDGNGVPQSLVVSLNNGLSGAADPTGIVFNGGTSFVLNSTVAGGAFNAHGGYSGALSGTSPFIFAGEGGTLTAWSPAVDTAHAYVVYDGSAGGAVYKGLAILTGTTNRLYAADFHNRRIDVFDGTFAKITVPGGFTDANIPATYGPFNIQAIGGQLYVAYAKKDPASDDEVAGAGFGYVDVFDMDGTLVKRLVGAGGALNAPWGMAMAPANFGSFSNMLLVGNFGDGKINAYDPTSGALVGTLSKAGGQAIVIDGLWGIAFGNNLNNQPSNTLFYAAGPSDEAHGAYGRIDMQ
jgi:uncharacterized protein (TIGR03118 family)